MAVSVKRLLARTTLLRNVLIADISLLAQGPVNLPPEAAGLRQALRKMHSYMWLEDAIADDGSAQAPGADTPLHGVHQCTLARTAAMDAVAPGCLLGAAPAVFALTLC